MKKQLATKTNITFKIFASRQINITRNQKNLLCNKPVRVIIQSLTNQVLYVYVYFYCTKTFPFSFYFVFMLIKVIMTVYKKNLSFILIFFDTRWRQISKWSLKVGDVLIQRE